VNASTRSDGEGPTFARVASPPAGRDSVTSDRSSVARSVCATLARGAGGATRARLVAGLLLVAGWAAVACAPRVEVEVRDEERLGSVRIFHSADAQAGLVFLFSDVGGWSDELERVARSIAASGAPVVGVDLPSYLRGLRESDDGCHYVVAEIEDLSQRLQREGGFALYRSPLLAGLGAGATLAYAALAQSPAATVAGALSVDPAASLGTRVPLCAGAPAREDPAGGWTYGSARDLPGFWWVSPRSSLPPSLAASAQEVPGVESRQSPEHRLLTSIETALASETATAAGLEDLPLVELPVDSPSRRMAVIYSGDGGWRDLDKDIAGVFAREGTPVVGVDSLRYFWREKTPETVAADLARILIHYRSRWGAPRVILVGYSFGAGILPFAVNRLPAELRADVDQISLLGLEPQAAFEISVTGWLGARARGLPVLPEILKLDLGSVQCVYGEEEETTLCTTPELAGSERIRTRGGHHFDGDYETLARRILDAAARRARASVALPES